MPLKFFANQNGTVDILAKQGESWEMTVQILDDEGNPFDLTGFSIKGGMKSKYQDEQTIIDFNCTIENATQGIIKVSLSPSDTSQIPAYSTSADGLRISSLPEGTQGVYVYDIKIYNSEKAIRILEGKIVVDPEVSN